MATNAANANSTANVVPQLLAQALIKLSERAIMPALVNRRYEAQAGERGSVISVPTIENSEVYEIQPSTSDTRDVSPITTGVINIALDKWYGNGFSLTDKEQTEIANGVVPQVANGVIQSITNFLDVQILNAAYKGTYNNVGVAGYTPFGSEAASTDATDVANFKAAGGSKVVLSAIRKLNEGFAPKEDRRLVLDAAAESQALGNPSYQNYAWSNNLDAIRDGTIQRMQGFSFFANQNLPFHVAGTSAALAAGARLATSGDSAVGNTTVAVASLVDGHFVEGDLITFGTDVSQYVVASQNSSGIVIAPGLRTAVASGTAITTTKSHTVNLAFQRDAIVFVNKPMLSSSATSGQTNTSTAVDPTSGLALRLEVSRQTKQDLWEFDVLFGVALLRPEHVVRILG